MIGRFILVKKRLLAITAIVTDTEGAVGMVPQYGYFNRKTNNTIIDSIEAISRHLPNLIDFIFYSLCGVPHYEVKTPLLR